MALRIRNWDEFQHYSRRNPPWIKLHREILSSEDWVMWDDASRVLAIACMLLASKNDGEIPENPEYVRRVAYLNCLPDFRPLISCGFLVCDTMLADASKLHTNARPETETETETETEVEQPPQRRKKFTPPTLAELQSYIEDKGYTFDAESFVAYYTANGWQVGRSSMKDWRAACVTWQKREGAKRAPQHVGATPTEHPWHPDDVREYGEHERWDEYLEMCLALPRNRWPAQRFSEWLAG